MKRLQRLAVVGVGLVGRRHVAAIHAARGATLACIVDPGTEPRAFAAQRQLPWYETLAAMLAAEEVDGVILATPNQLHVAGALACIAAGVPVLVEKPLASDEAGGRRIVELARDAGVPVATGHHRRHNPQIARAKEMIDQGRLGRIAAVHAMFWLIKPEAYYDAAWRRQQGAGPIYINLIHDIDLLRHFCGPITSVQAIESNAIRGLEVEDTAAMTLRFASGALGTVSICDTAAAPWSWELTARENPAYPTTDEAAYWIGGTAGSLSLPNLSLWTHPEAQSWHAPIAATKPVVDFADPLVRQIEQFAAVIRGDEPPLVSGEDGLQALRIIDAIKASAQSGQAVELD